MNRDLRASRGYAVTRSITYALHRSDKDRRLYGRLPRGGRTATTTSGSVKSNARIRIRTMIIMVTTTQPLKKKKTPIKVLIYKGKGKGKGGGHSRVLGAAGKFYFRVRRKTTYRCRCSAFLFPPSSLSSPSSPSSSASRPCFVLASFSAPRSLAAFRETYK